MVAKSFCLPQEYPARIVAIGTATVLALSAWWQLRFMDSVIAWQGQSAIAWVEKLWRPEAFAGDFPTASDGYGKSLFMQLYPLLEGAFGWNPEAVLPWVLVLEILLISSAVYALTVELVPRASRCVPWIVVLMTVADPWRPSRARTPSAIPAAG